MPTRLPRWSLRSSPDKRNPEQGEGLTCLECGRHQAADERGWRAYLTVDDADNEEPVEAIVLCPACATREFGGPPKI